MRRLQDVWLKTSILEFSVEGISPRVLVSEYVA